VEVIDYFPRISSTAVFLRREEILTVRDGNLDGQGKTMPPLQRRLRGHKAKQKLELKSIEKTQK